MDMSEQRILTHAEISMKLQRLAHQIIEQSWDLDRIFLGGITGNGWLITQEIAEIIQKNSNISVCPFEIKVNKEQPWSEPITLTMEMKELKNGHIFLIDDVINSGKTMQFALVKFLEQPSAFIKTVAIIDRKHRRYPIKADLVGMSLSTTLAERVEIFQKNDEFEAHLV